MSSAMFQKSENTINGSDVDISIPSIHQSAGKNSYLLSAGMSVLELLAVKGFSFSAPCGGYGACGNCRIRFVGIELPPPTQVEKHHLSAAELEHGIRLACQVRTENNIRISFENFSKGSKWRKLLDDGYLPVDNSTSFSSSSNKNQYGIAVDLGTTQIRMTLWDMQRGIRMSGRSVINPQMCFGADILNRVAAAVESESDAHKISLLAGKIIAEGLTILAGEMGISRDSIRHITIVGNTAMLSLLSGRNYELLLQPEYWMKEVDFQPRDINNLIDLWQIDRKTAVELIPSAAGFVGSDLLAAVLYTDMIKKYKRALLIDFGTNSEIALWDGKTLWVTSAAGGPAFDGCGIYQGMPGETGAVYQIDCRNSHSGFKCRIIGDGNPKGICGSGIIDAVACMLKSDLLKPSGRFRKEYKSDEVVLYKGLPDIVIKNRDIDVFQRAKAAVGAGISCLLNEGDIPSEDLQVVFVCGAFGQHLNIRNSQSLGLLPDIPVELFNILGNAALGGCEKLLLSRESQKTLFSIKQLSRVLDLSRHSEFEDAFLENLFLNPITIKPEGSHV